MQLKIKQKKITFFINKYEIFENDNLIYTAKSILFSFPKRIIVLNTNQKKVIELTKAITFIHPEFIINFLNGNNIRLIGKSWIYEYFIIRVPEGEFEIHHQKGLKLSIFLNQEQVAEISKNCIKYFNGDEFTINANSSVSKELLIGICLAWELNDFDDDSATLTFDIGNIGPVKKKEIPNWVPNEE